jgi:hypothetical protein
MGYTGTTAPIPMGEAGLFTDAPQSVIPVNAAIVANNVTLYNGKLLKSPGSTRYNASQALSSEIVALFDWWPTASTQRLIAATSDGHVYRDTGDATFSSGTALGVVETQKIVFSSIPDSGSVTFSFNSVSTAVGLSVTSATTAAFMQTNLRTIPALANCEVSGTMAAGFLVVMYGTVGNQPMLTTSANTLLTGATPVTFTFTEVAQGGASLGTLTPDTHFCSGGAEVSGNSRKLFMFSSTAQVKVIQADGTALRDMLHPAADWASNFPTFGVIYQGRMVCFGNANDRHRLYISKFNDHEDFTTTATDGTGAASFSIFSGEGDGIVSAIVYKGALLLFKQPFGIYIFQWNGGDLGDPTNFSIDRFSDSFGIASPHATQIALDDLMSGDNSMSVKSLKATNAFGALEAGDYFALAKVRDHIRQNLDGSGLSHMHSLYYPEKEILYFTGRASTTSTHQDRLIQINLSGQTPRISVETKDQPTCLALRRDSNKIQRPIYGAADGYVYLMDQTTRNVANTAYVGEFQTPFSDLSYLDGSLADKTKLFDFLQVTFTATGNWSFYVDVYIDGAFKETVQFRQGSLATLDSFTLDVSRLANLLPQQIRNPLHCSGKTISLRIYNGNLNETFNVERLVLGFRVGGESNRSS